MFLFKIIDEKYEVFSELLDCKRYIVICRIDFYNVEHYQQVKQIVIIILSMDNLHTVVINNTFQSDVRYDQ